MNQKIEFIDLKAQYALLKETINARIQRVLEHGQYAMGPEVAELEERLATYTGASHCVTVASGTDALLISLMALGIKSGDEVITTPFTFVATAEVIALVGATPVFVDIEPCTCNINSDKISAAITPKTRAIMPVSLYGQPADMDEINAIAARHGLPVIEDAAQSFGATYHNKKSANLSTIGCTSFFPSKPLGCYGDGGAIFTSDATLANAMREIRVHGQAKHYHYSRIGVCGRMDSLQCAIVLAKLERFEHEVKARTQHAECYLSMLKSIPAITLPHTKPNRSSVWAQFTVQVQNRDLLAASLKKANVPTAIHYPIPLHQQPAYQNICRSSGALAEAEGVASRVLSLPFHPYLTEETQAQVATALTAAVEPKES